MALNINAYKLYDSAHSAQIKTKKRPIKIIKLSDSFCILALDLIDCLNFKNTQSQPVSAQPSPNEMHIVDYCCSCICKIYNKVTVCSMLLTPSVNIFFSISEHNDLILLFHLYCHSTKL